MKLFFICTPQLRVCPGGNFASPCSKILGSPLGENFFTLRRMIFPPLLGQKFNFTPPSGKKNFSPREILHPPLSHVLVHVWTKHADYLNFIKMNRSWMWLLKKDIFQKSISRKLNDFRCDHCESQTFLWICKNPFYPSIQ